MTNCGRCLSLKGEIKKGWIPVIGPQGIKDHVCKECYEEITYENDVIYTTIDEEQENKNLY